MQTDLKPCPFCGSKAMAYFDHEDNIATCTNDNCPAMPSSVGNATLQEAIDKWNTRFAAPEVERKNDIIEQCAKACEDYSAGRWAAYKRGPLDHPDRANPHVQGEADGATDCAGIIRALKVREPQGERS